MNKNVTPKAKLFILVSQIGFVGVVGTLGVMLAIETWRDAASSRGTLAQWMIAAIGAVCLFGLTASVLWSMVELIRQPSTTQNEQNESPADK